MKSITLALMLALQATGLWSHLSAPSRAHLAAKASGVTAPATLPITPPPAPLVPLPVRGPAGAEPHLGVASAFAIDRDTATVLYAQNSGAHRPIASVTKLITALVILSRHDPTETITLPKLPDYPPEAETIGLVSGDTFTLQQILEAALVPSANDAADAMAIWDAGSVAKFTTRMNAKMAEWGISDTHFASASGLQDSGNYASAAALAKMAGLALHNPTIVSIINNPNMTIASRQGRTYTAASTNELLDSGGFYGIKTGYTLAAGECFVGLTRIKGHEIITVVLGSDDRFGSTVILTNWIARTWQWL
ncbi:MAG TPA: serine hydrolase [Candidatus Saccharimonadia bacterium]|nr:serine hydrolase [Candidatus Saccharimonadia bacterium]